jgi:hypothetical protein
MACRFLKCWFEKKSCRCFLGRRRSISKRNVPPISQQGARRGDPSCRIGKSRVLDSAKESVSDAALAEAGRFE